MKQSEGDGYIVTAWAVEVDGKIDTDLVYSTRSNARASRNYECYGSCSKAVVRKVKIEVLEGKI